MRFKDKFINIYGTIQIDYLDKDFVSEMWTYESRSQIPDCKYGKRKYEHKNLHNYASIAHETTNTNQPASFSIKCTFPIRMYIFPCNYRTKRWTKYIKHYIVRRQHLDIIVDESQRFGLHFENDSVCHSVYKTSETPKEKSVYHSNTHKNTIHLTTVLFLIFII